MKIELWTVPYSPFKDLDQYEYAAGYIIAEYMFKETLDPGYYFHDFKQTLARKDIGEYGCRHIIVMKLYSKQNFEWRLRDSSVFKKPIEIYREKVTMSGQLGYTIKSQGTMIEMRVGKISNEYSCRTGTLRLLFVVFDYYKNMTDEQYKTASFYTLATSRLREIEKDYSMTDVIRTVDLDKIQKGTYKPGFKLQEYQRWGFKTVETFIFNGTYES